MSLKDIWQDRQDNVHDVTAGDVNLIARAVIECEEKGESHNGDSQAHITEEERKKVSAAVLLAMYNEVDVTPADGDLFVFDETYGTITGMDASTEEKYKRIAAMQELVVPYSINGVLVTTIGNFINSILSHGSFKKIRLPNSIRKIADNAFRGTTEIVSVNIPTSCEYLGAGSFYNTTIKEVITPIKPNWELTIGQSAFHGADGLNNVDTIIDGIKEIPYRAFYGCGRLKAVTIPESVDNVGKEAFGECLELRVVTILNPYTILTDNFCNNSAIIRGYTGSTAQEYAAQNGNPFIAIDAIGE